MKPLLIDRRQQGMALVTVLFIALLVALVVGALLVIARQQHYLTARSRTWNAEIPIAEAGIEEAMAHINLRTHRFDIRGWSRISGTSNVAKQNAIGDGYYYTVITTSKPPIITSIGYGRIPLTTNFTHRTVLAVTKLSPPAFGIVGKSSVTFNGNPYVDSYDSSDTNASVNGKWSLATRSDRAGVGTLSTNAGAIDTGNNGEIYGSAATGPGGSVTGTVGDGQWLSSGGSGLQPGHVTDDFNMAIPNASLPTNWPAVPQMLALPAIYNGVTYTYGLNGGDWQFGAVNISSGGILVQGNVRIYFTGDFKMTSSASVTLAPGATLEVYLGRNMDLAGNCVINPTGVPGNCTIYGLPGCTSISYAGNAEAYCRVYAPNADITITGNFDFSGSVVGNNVTFKGNASVHYDEALSAGKPDYTIVSWQELPQ